MLRHCGVKFESFFNIPCDFRSGQKKKKKTSFVAGMERSEVHQSLVLSHGTELRYVFMVPLKFPL